MRYMALLCVYMHTSAVDAPRVIDITLTHFDNGTFLLSLEFDQEVLYTYVNFFHL